MQILHNTLIFRLKIIQIIVHLWIHLTDLSYLIICVHLMQKRLLILASNVVMANSTLSVEESII